MNKIKIIYLSPEFLKDLDYKDNEERDKQIIEHKDREIYSLDSFAEAFNSEWISDRGFIVIENIE